jgi:hypothetical protein
MEKKLTASQRAAKRRYWQQHFENWKESGLTQVKYRRRHGLKQHQWWYWKKRLVDSSVPVKFVRLDLDRLAEAESEGSRFTPLRVVVGNGFRIEIDKGFDPSTLVQLVRVLRRC